jgi:hypothetical protein
MPAFSWNVSVLSADTIYYAISFLFVQFITDPYTGQQWAAWCYICRFVRLSALRVLHASTSLNIWHSETFTIDIQKRRLKYCTDFEIFTSIQYEQHCLHHFLPPSETAVINVFETITLSCRTVYTTFYEMPYISRCLYNFVQFYHTITFWWSS